MPDRPAAMLRPGARQSRPTAAAADPRTAPRSRPQPPCAVAVDRPHPAGQQPPIGRAHARTGSRRDDHPTPGSRRRGTRPIRRAVRATAARASWRRHRSRNRCPRSLLPAAASAPDPRAANPIRGRIHHPTRHRRRRRPGLGQQLRQLPHQKRVSARPLKNPLDTIRVADRPVSNSDTASRGRPVKFIRWTSLSAARIGSSSSESRPCVMSRRSRSGCPAVAGPHQRAGRSTLRRPTGDRRGREPVRCDRRTGEVPSAASRTARIVAMSPIPDRRTPSAAQAPRAIQTRSLASG